MQLTRAGLDLIKRHEGLRLTAYLCPAGKWTIGYGHTSAAGLPIVKKGMKIGQAEADRILLDDLKVFEAYVTNAVKVKLSPSQYSALVSFCYNVGPTYFNKSSVLKAVNTKRFDQVPSRLALWNMGGGRVLPGLVKRRADEGNLFMSGVIGEDVYPSTQVTPVSGKPILASTTNLAAIGIGAAGATSTIAQITGDIGNIKDNIGAEMFTLILGAIIVLGAGYIVYQRYIKSKSEGV